MEGTHNLAYFGFDQVKEKKMFENNDTWCQCYKTFFLHCWWWGL